MRSASAEVSSLIGQSVSVIADQHLVSVGSVFKGTDGLYVEGKDTTALYAATNTVQSSTSTQTSSSFLGLNLDNKTSTDSNAHSTAIATRLLSTQKVDIGIGNQAELQGTDIDAPQIVFTQTDPSKAGVLILGTSSNTQEASHTEKSESLGLYQESKGQGSTVQTLNQTTLKGNVTFDAGLKITAQVPKDVQTTKGGQALAAQVQTLQQTLGSNSTGLAYLNQLASNPNVQWDKVALANAHWSYDQAGLTPAGAALLSIAVAAYTGGLGAELLGGTVATSASAATLAGSTAFATAVNAGFASLAAQASVAMVNNGGDIGKTLNQLGSEQSIKGLLTSMVTAGALDKLGSAGMFNGQSGVGAAGPNSLSTAQTAATFGDKLLKNITNNVAGAAIDSAINGKPLDEKALTNALSNALITTGMASGAKSIGDGKDAGNLNVFTQAVAHATLGCLAGSASAGNGPGCSAGAVGGVVGELSANYALLNGASREDAITFAKVVAAASGVIVGGGGDNVAAVNIAATTGANAAANNRTLHMTEAQKLVALKQGKTQIQQDRLDAAACALIHCAEGVPDGDTSKAKLLALQTAGAGYMQEQSQLVATGEFVYSKFDAGKDYAISTLAPGAKNAAKVGTGFLALATGGTICAASGYGCAIGVPLASFGVSEMVEGGAGLYSQFNGIGTTGYNPVKAGINTLAPQYGDGIYDATYLTFSVLSLTAPVKLVVGVSDGTASALGPIERTKSMFKVEVPKFDNPILNPLTGTVLVPQIGAQAITVFNTSKSAKNVANEVVNPKDGK
jgi:Possible hemagglutinin (DUF637)